MSAFLKPTDLDPFPVELATRLALLGFSILAMQFVISARIKWVERPFGLDQIFRFHKAMAVVAASVLLLHPVLLAAGHGNLDLITSILQPAPIIVGKLALLSLFVLAIVSIYRKTLNMEYEKWLVLHNAVALVVLVLVGIHAFILGADVELPATHYVMAAVLLFGVIAYIKHTLYDPLTSKKNAYQVVSVKRETHDVCTLELAPADGGSIPEYLPGQFGFLTLHRKCSKEVEEHPFTISSSPTENAYFTTTIKSSGNFTSTIVVTKPGDTAELQGPFGRFSYVLHPDEHDLVFISGGIGITPLMSMLRHMRDTNADINVRMLCFNRTEDDIAFRDELAEIESGGVPKLNLTHLLSTPSSTWQRGHEYANREMIEKLLGDDIESKVYYVCGPPAMMRIVFDALLDLGVPESRIRYESFSL